MLDSITAALTASGSASLATAPEAFIAMGFSLVFGLVISLCYLKRTEA